MPKVVDIYVFERKIGQGQFGEVYKGINRETFEDVAIKTVSRQNLTGKFLELLENEIKVLRACENPNIIKLYDIKKTPNNIYLILEFCNEGDLMKYLQSRKKLTEEEAVEFLMQIINGFKTLVRAKIMHRDFKLANILLHNGTIKIADFGFAKLLGNENMASTMLGSPLNMAPEVLQSMPYSSKADIWSIGCCFYELLFGKPPFTSNNIPNLIRTIKTTQLVFPRKVNPITPVVEDALRKMLVIDPEARIEWEDLFRHPVLSYREEKIKKELEDSLKSEINKTLQMSKFYLRNNIIWNHPNDVIKRNELNNFTFDVVQKNEPEDQNPHFKILKRNKPMTPRGVSFNQGVPNVDLQKVAENGTKGDGQPYIEDTVNIQKPPVEYLKPTRNLMIDVPNSGDTPGLGANLYIPLNSPMGNRSESPNKILKRSNKPYSPKRSGIITIPVLNESKTFSENSEDDSKAESPRGSQTLIKRVSKPKSPRKSQFSSVLEPEMFGFGETSERPVQKENIRSQFENNEGNRTEEAVNISPGTKILKRNKLGSPRRTNFQLGFGHFEDEASILDSSFKHNKDSYKPDYHAASEASEGETQKEREVKEIKYCGRRLLHERNKYVFLGSVADELMQMRDIEGADIFAFLLVKKMLGLFETLTEKIHRRENVFGLDMWEDFLHCKEFYLVYDEINKGFQIFKGLYSQLLVLALNQARALDPQKNLAYDEEMATVLNHNYSQKFDELFRRVTCNFAKGIFLKLFEIKDQSPEQEEELRSIWILFEKVLDASKLDQAFPFETTERMLFSFNEYYERGQEDEMQELMARTLGKYKMLEL